MQATRRVLEAVKAPFEYVDLEAGFELFQKTGVALPEATVKTLRECTGSIFGAVRSDARAALPSVATTRGLTPAAFALRT